MTPDERAALLAALDVKEPISAEDVARRVGWTLERTEAALLALKAEPHPPLFSFAPVPEDGIPRRYQSTVAWMREQ